MIDPIELADFVTAALREDVGDGDHTTLACIPADDRSQAKLLVKDVGVISGVQVARQIFSQVDPTHTFEQLIEDGSDIKHGDIVFRVDCNTHALLQAERLVLNVMQRMSGISSLSARFAAEVEGTGVTILDTRKTTPLLRFLEKEAVAIGGCANYRIGLYDRIMIKDNHVEAAGGVTAAIQKTLQYLESTARDLPIIVEVRNLMELDEVLAIGRVDRIMLDNFEIPLIHEALRIINGAYETEASGGIELGTVRKYAETGVDFISVGALTHSAGTLDLSLKIIEGS